MRKRRKLWKLLIFMILAAGSCGIFSLCATAGSVYESPYVTFSPDGIAFTTNLGDADYSW